MSEIAGECVPRTHTDISTDIYGNMSMYRAAAATAFRCRSSGDNFTASGLQNLGKGEFGAVVSKISNEKTFPPIEISGNSSWTGREAVRGCYRLAPSPIWPSLSENLEHLVVQIPLL